MGGDTGLESGDTEIFVASGRRPGRDDQYRWGTRETIFLIILTVAEWKGEQD